MFDHDRIVCPECGDRLIHQNKRREHEAASGLLQWIHNLDRKMDVIDDDEDPGSFDVVRRQLRPPLWRRCECKPMGGKFSDSQKFLLPRIAATIEHGVNMKLYYPTSGVFGIWSDYPYDMGTIRRVRPVLPLAFGQKHELSGDEWKRFWLATDQNLWR